MTLARVVRGDVPYSNCCVAPNARSFANRQWTFLRDGKSKGVPISPFLDIPAVVIKDKNEEVRSEEVQVIFGSS